MRNIRSYLDNQVEPYKLLSENERKDELENDFLHSVRNYFLESLMTNLTSIKILNLADNGVLEVMDFNCTVNNFKSIEFEKNSIKLIAEITLSFYGKSYERDKTYCNELFLLTPVIGILFKDTKYEEIIFEHLDFAEVKKGITV